MVAESESIPPAPKPKKNAPGAESALASSPALNFAKGRGNRIPESLRLAIRSFYVVQGLGPAEIAPMVRMAPLQVRNLIAREKWAPLRAAKQKVRESKMIQLQDARASEDVARIVEAVAIRSEELSVRSLDFCGELLDAKDAKGLQMASGAARNFVQISRLSRGLDRGDASGGAGGKPSVSVFVVTGERLERPMRQADLPESAEQSAAQSVVEVRAIPAP